MHGRLTITLGPLLFNCTPERWREFYARIADEAPIDVVCLGEVVCSKRTPFVHDVMGEVVDRLERAGVCVVFSTLAMPTLARERRHLEELVGATDKLIEANDATALAELAKRPHVIGPFVNVYNEATLACLASRGACRVCLPPELPLASIRTIAAAAGEVALEVLAFGRTPLSISARCHHARVHGLAKDSCQFVCAEDADGLDADTLDGQPFLCINGVQTLSRTYACLLGEVPELAAAGVSGLRLSPHTCDMVAVSRLYRDVADGRREPGAAMEALRRVLPGLPLSNGFLLGVEGAAFVTRPR
jgi:collagenase-like PrtC family protease